MAPALPADINSAGYAAYCGFVVARRERIGPLADALIGTLRPWSELHTDERAIWHIIGMSVLGWWSDL